MEMDYVDKMPEKERKAANRAKSKKYYGKTYQKNKDRINARRRAHYRKNKEKINAKRRELYAAKKASSTPKS